MSVEWSKWAKSVKGLSRREKQVLVWLADFYNDEKGCAWPSQDKLAEIAVYSRSTINKACKELRKKGLISWTKKMREFGRFHSNQYKLHRVAIDHMVGGHNTVYQNETSPCSKTKHKLLYRTLNRTLNDSDAFKGSKYDAPIERYAKYYFDDLKEGKPNPFWNSSWGPKPTDSDYQHKDMLKRLGFNPEDFADD